MRLGVGIVPAPFLSRRAVLLGDEEKWVPLSVALNSIALLRPAGYIAPSARASAARGAVGDWTPVASAAVVVILDLVVRPAAVVRAPSSLGARTPE